MQSRVGVRELYFFNHDEGGNRSRERAREAGPPRREEGWASEEGGQLGLGFHDRNDAELVGSRCTKRGRGLGFRLQAH